MSSGAARRQQLADARVYLVWTVGADEYAEREAVLSALRSECVGVVQLRAQGVTPIDAVGAWLGEVSRAHGALFIVNDDPEAAVRLDADGVHVGQDDTPAPEARRIVGSERLVGLSTHDPAEIRTAAALDIDYLGLGPCFPSGSKDLALDPGGADLVRRCLPAAGERPVFPIGGITVANVAVLAAAGARRVAVGAGILQASDPAQAARSIFGAVGAPVP